MATSRGSFGQLKGVNSPNLQDALQILTPLLRARGLTQTTFIDLVARKANFLGSLDFLELDYTGDNPSIYTPTPINHVQYQPQQSFLVGNNPVLQNAGHLMPDIEKLVLQQVHELTKIFNTEVVSMKKDITMLTNVIHSVVTSKPTTISNDYNTLPTEILSKINTTSFNNLFAEQFNGITVSDYHTVVNEGLSYNTNEAFYPVTPNKSNPTPDKPTYVMQQFIAEYNKDFRSVIINYIQNKPLVEQLSIDDNKLLNYIRTRYQRLGDMDTYTKLTSLTLSDLSLCELTELLEPLLENAFTITKPQGDIKYPPMSNESRFKSAFNAEFDSAWKNDITEFTSI